MTYILVTKIVTAYLLERQAERQVVASSQEPVALEWKRGMGGQSCSLYPLLKVQKLKMPGSGICGRQESNTCTPSGRVNLAYPAGLVCTSRPCLLQLYSIWASSLLNGTFHIKSPSFIIQCVNPVQSCSLSHALQSANSIPQLT